MKKFKVAGILMYITIVIVGLSAIIISCIDNQDKVSNIYRINTSKIDSIPGYDNLYLDSLFNSGITGKYIDGHRYFIWNKLSDCNDLKVLLWGPITRYNEDYYTIDYTIKDNTINFDLRIKLVNKFHHKIDRIIFNPSWLGYSGDVGLIGIQSLDRIVINFENGLQVGDKFELPIIFDAVYSTVQSNPLLMSVNATCIYGDFAFVETMTFNIKNIWY